MALQNIDLIILDIIWLKWMVSNYIYIYIIIHLSSQIYTNPIDYMFHKYMINDLSWLLRAMICEKILWFMCLGILRQLLLSTLSGHSIKIHSAVK